MATYLLLLKERGQNAVGLGEVKFAAIPRSGEFVNHIVHVEFDEDEAPVAKEDEMDGGMRRRWYRVDAVVHFTNPLKREDEDPALDGYLIVSNVGPSSKFNAMRHRGRKWLR